MTIERFYVCLHTCVKLRWSIGQLLVVLEMTRNGGEWVEFTDVIARMHKRPDRQYWRAFVEAGRAAGWLEVRIQERGKLEMKLAGKSYDLMERLFPGVLSARKMAARDEMVDFFRSLIWSDDNGLTLKRLLALLVLRGLCGPRNDAPVTVAMLLEKLPHKYKDRQAVRCVALELAKAGMAERWDRGEISRNGRSVHYYRLTRRALDVMLPVLVDCVMRRVDRTALCVMEPGSLLSKVMSDPPKDDPTVRRNKKVGGDWQKNEGRRMKGVGI